MSDKLKIEDHYEIVPLSNRVIVKVDEAETKTAGGIIIPDEAQEKPLSGKVHAIGPGIFHEGAYEPMEVEVGDTVVFNKYAGKDITFKGVDYKVMRTEDIEFKLKSK